MTAVGDPAVPVIGVVIAALADAYGPTSSFPPDLPGNTVRFFAGEGPATAAFNAHSNETDCTAPFLWARVMRRYRSESLPDASSSNTGCRAPRAVSVELGVGRCAVLEENPSWEDYETEAVISLEDSWRIEVALCAAAARLNRDGYTVAVEEIMPYGPEGGIIAWTATIHIQFD